MSCMTREDVDALNAEAGVEQDSRLDDIRSCVSGVGYM